MALPLALPEREAALPLGLPLGRALRVEVSEMRAEPVAPPTELLGEAEPGRAPLALGPWLPEACPLELWLPLRVALAQALPEAPREPLAPALPLSTLALML